MLSIGLDLDKQFFDAAKINDLKTMKTTFSAKTNLPLATVLTSLAMASLNGHIDTVNYLLNLLSYYNVNSNSADGYAAALYAASKAGHLNIVTALLTHKNRKNLTYLELGQSFCFAFMAEKDNVRDYFYANHSNEILHFFPILCTKYNLDIAIHFFEQNKLQSVDYEYTLFQALQNLEERNQKDCDSIRKFFNKNHEESPTLLAQLDISIDKNGKLRQKIVKNLAELELKRSNLEEDDSEDIDIFETKPALAPSERSFSEFTSEENIVRNFNEAAKNGQLDKIITLLTQEKTAHHYVVIGQAFRNAFNCDQTNVMDYLLNNYLFECEAYFFENMKELSPAEIAYAFHHTLKTGLFDSSVNFLNNNAQFLTTNALHLAVKILNLKIEEYTKSGKTDDKIEHQEMFKVIEGILLSRKSKNEFSARSVPFTSQNRLKADLKAPQYDLFVERQKSLEIERKKQRDAHVDMLKADGTDPKHIVGIMAVWDEVNPPFNKPSNS